MGQDLYQASADVRRLYELASGELDADITRISFEGPADELKRTRFTQPAILLHSLAVLIVLGENLPQFDYACGHSLGEYAALAATGALSFDDAVRAVVRRATLMEQACEQNQGTMAAIIGLNEQQVVDICAKASINGIVIPANHNSMIQIAISGSLPAVEKAVALAKEAGAKRAMLLEVGGAFHSPLMEPARGGLREYLKSIDIKSPRHPVVANVTAQPSDGAEHIRSLLVDQVAAPVRWMQTMQFLKDNGVTSTIEIGPGKVLTGLARRDMKPEKTTVLDRLTDIETFAAATA